MRQNFETGPDVPALKKPRKRNLHEMIGERVIVADLQFESTVKLHTKALVNAPENTKQPVITSLSTWTFVLR